jgi:hypothetical protein
VDGVAHGLLESDDGGIQPSGRGPAIAPWKRHQLGPCAIGIDSQDARPLTHVEVSSQALGTSAADYVGFNSHQVSDRQIVNPFTQGHDQPGHLMAHDPWGMDSGGGPGIPIQDVKVGAADTHRHRLEQRLTGAGPGIRDLRQLCPSLRMPL